MVKIKIMNRFVILFCVALFEVVVGVVGVLVLVVVVSGGKEELSIPGQPTSQSSQAP